MIVCCGPNRAGTHWWLRVDGYKLAAENRTLASPVAMAEGRARSTKCDVDSRAWIPAYAGMTEGDGVTTAAVVTATTPRAGNEVDVEE
jgi:hypothetical protein